MSPRSGISTASSRPSGPAPPPRAAARRVPPQRRRRRRLVVVGLALAVVLAVLWAVSVSPFLDVDRVQVRGLDHLGADEIEAAGDVHPGDAMLWIDTSRAVERIEALPFVREASVSREWPDTVRITVRERRPAAWIQGPGGIVLVDGAGRVLEAIDAAPPGVPQLVGAKIVPPPGARIDALDAARVAGALTGLAAAGTSSVAVTEQGIVLHLTSGPEIRMGDATRIGVKLRAGLAVLAASQGVPVAYVDVSVPTNPVAG